MRSGSKSMGVGVESVERSTMWRTLADARVWVLTGAYLAAGTGGIGAVFFLPLMIRSMGFSVWSAGFLSALPGLIAALCVPLWGIWADRARSRERVVAAGCGAIAVGLLGAAALLPSPWALAPLSISMVGFYGFLPAAFLTGANAALGIGFINATGNLANFSGPYLFGLISDRSHSYATSLVSVAAIAACAVALMLLLLLMRWNRKMGKAPM